MLCNARLDHFALVKAVANSTDDRSDNDAKESQTSFAEIEAVDLRIDEGETFEEALWELVSIRTHSQLSM